MKRIVFYLLSVFFLLSCNLTVQEKKGVPEKFTNLDFIRQDTLTLHFLNEKCGEWGGDSREIYIYNTSVDRKDILFADVEVRSMDCDSIQPEKQNEISFEKRKIMISKADVTFISEAIKEIVDMKMNFDASIGISNSGCSSGLKTTNDKLFISIYPSPRWIKFDLLFEKLKK